MGAYIKYKNLDYETDSTILILADSSTQSYSFSDNAVYSKLDDKNDQDGDNLISAYVVRESILSIWDSNPFKETKSVGFSTNYIGVDSGDPSNLDLKRKIYFGKREYNGVDIVNDRVLDSDPRYSSDIIIFNTKEDNISQDKTQISILAGINKNLYEKAPYISTQILEDQSFSFDIVNPQYSFGDIKITSLMRDFYTGDDLTNGGTVSINQLIFPTNDDNLQVSLNNKVMIYKDGKMQWMSLTMSQNNFIGDQNQPLDIFGDFKVNNNSLLFNDNRKVPLKIGDIQQGDSFTDSNLFEILNKLVYEYIPPQCTISLHNTPSYLEVGTSPIVTLKYSITKRTKNTLPTALINMLPTSYPSIVSNTSKKVEGYATGLLIKPIQEITTVFTIKTNDGTDGTTSMTSVTGIYPYYHGFLPSNFIDTKVLSSLNRIIEPKNNKSFFINGDGFYFFIYDKNYGPLSSIEIVENGTTTNITSDFTNSIMVLSSPIGYWQSKQFYVYVANMTKSLPVKIKFNY